MALCFSASPIRWQETPSPDVLVVPGGATTPGEMVDDEVLDWLRQVHQTTIWTVSVCTGALILGTAGILKGLPATTHWYKTGVLRILGGKPKPEERMVRAGKIVTAAGVSAGIDLALWLAGEIVGRERAEAIAEKSPGGAYSTLSVQVNEHSAALLVEEADLLFAGSLGLSLLQRATHDAQYLDRS